MADTTDHSPQLQDRDVIQSEPRMLPRASGQKNLVLCKSFKGQHPPLL